MIWLHINKYKKKSKIYSHDLKRTAAKLTNEITVTSGLFI